MKKALFLSLTLLFFSHFSFAQKKLIKVAAPNLMPFVYEYNNEIKGSLIECLEQYSGEFIFDVTIMPWARAIHEVKMSRFDALMPTLKNEDRQAFLSYPNKQILNLKEDIIVSLNNTPELNFNSRQNFIIGKLRSSPISPELNAKLDDANITLYEVIDYPTLLKMLSLNKLNYFVADEEIITFISQEQNMYDHIKFQRISNSIRNSYLAFSKAFSNQFDVNAIMNNLDCQK